MRILWGGVFAVVLASGCAEAGPSGVDGGVEPHVPDDVNVLPHEMEAGTALPDDITSDDPTLIVGIEPPPAVDAGADFDDEEPGGGDLVSVLSEADIVQVEGDRVFALSYYGALTVIDASDPSALRELGQYVFTGTPFEMYLRGDVVIALVSVASQTDLGFTEVTDVIALDVSDPEAMRVRSQTRLSGAIVDSRASEAWLYLVLQERSGSTVYSVALSDPDAIGPVDDLPTQSYAHTAYFGPARAYVALAGASDDDSRIQVVELDAETGALEQGASIAVEGRVEFRWQLDEHEDVLRVIAQGLDFGEPPVVQTYRIAGDTAAQLGELEMVLPRPEDLRSVRFDGARAYAITFEQTDPLFTFDLSDPASPLQLGELEIPGWVRFMEPRGDRLIGLGYDSDFENRNMNVSLFDVSDLEQPTLLARVDVEGDNREATDRLHKSFRVLDEEGLILVPFQLDAWLNEGDCYLERAHGVQLIDFTRDTLALRGRAAVAISAERALVHRDHLITIGSHRVEAFDISDRDAPESVSAVHVMLDMQQAGIAGEQLVRLVDRDDAQRSGRLEVVALDDPNARRPLSSIELAAHDDETEGCSDAAFHSTLLTTERHALIVRTVESRANEDVKASLTIVDLADPAHAEIVYDAELDDLDGHQRIDSIELVGDALVLQGIRRELDEDDVPRAVGATLFVLDLAEPSAPSMHALDLGPTGGRSPLAVLGDQVYLTLAERLEGRLVRNTLVQVDLAKPEAPAVVERTTVLGSLLAMLDERTALTQSFDRKDADQIEYYECSRRGHLFAWRPDSGSTADWGSLGACEWLYSSLHVLTLDEGAVTLAGTLQALDAPVLSRASDGGRAVISFGRSQQADGSIDDFVLAQAPREGRQVLSIVDVPEIEYGARKVFLHGQTALAMTYEKTFAIELAAEEPAVREIDTMGAGWNLSASAQDGDVLVAARHYQGISVYSMSE